MTDNATGSRAEKFWAVRAALLDALAQVYDLPLSDAAADVVAEAILEAL